MAKKAAASARVRGRTKAANPKPTTPVAVTLRARPEWVAWLDSLCASLDTIGSGLGRTQAIDYALRLLGERQGLSGPPSRL